MSETPILSVEEILHILNTPFPYGGRMITLKLNEFYKVGLATAIHTALVKKGS